MRAILVALVAGSLFLSGCLGGSSPQRNANPSAPSGGEGAGSSDAGAGGASPGPAWSFTDTDGIVRSRDSSEGKPVLLFFMASWCGSCRARTGTLASVHSDYAARSHFYSVSFDSTDDAASLEDWKQRYGQPWPHGVDPGFAIQRTFGVTSQSSVVVLDEFGNVVRKFGYGGGTDAEIRAALDSGGATAA